MRFLRCCPPRAVIYRVSSNHVLTSRSFSHRSYIPAKWHRIDSGGAQTSTVKVRMIQKLPRISRASDGRMSGGRQRCLCDGSFVAKRSSGGGAINPKQKYSGVGSASSWRKKHWDCHGHFPGSSTPLPSRMNHDSPVLAEATELGAGVSCRATRLQNDVSVSGRIFTQRRRIPSGGTLRGTVQHATDGEDNRPVVKVHGYLNCFMHDLTNYSHIFAHFYEARTCVGPAPPVHIADFSSCHVTNVIARDTLAPLERRDQAFPEVRWIGVCVFP